MTSVLVFGTFDIFHPGHEFFLKSAKKYGNRLIVVLARDETVLQVKGRDPQNDVQARKHRLESVEYVNEVRVGYVGDKLKIVEEINPDVICLGYDQEAFTHNLEERLKLRRLFPKIVRIKSHYPEKFKSSKFRNLQE